MQSPDEARCPQLILRYYNQAWLHAVILKELISCNQMKKLTTRKMFGVYYHDLTSQGGMMLRIVSGTAANGEEEEERQFNTIKTITKRTCNYSQAQLVPNVLLRLQVQSNTRENDSVQKQQSEITKLALALRTSKNTTIPFTMIKKYSREWQFPLIEISDYLVQGKGVWWTKYDCIELFDISNQPANAAPELHHFRSSNFSKQKVYLKECWEECLHNPSLILANVIRIDQMDGSTKVIHIANLGEESVPPSLTCRNS